MKRPGTTVTGTIFFWLLVAMLFVLASVPADARHATNGKIAFRSGRFKDQTPKINSCYATLPAAYPDAQAH